MLGRAAFKTADFPAFDHAGDPYGTLTSPTFAEKERADPSGYTKYSGATAVGGRTSNLPTLTPTLIPALALKS